MYQEDSRYQKLAIFLSTWIGFSSTNLGGAKVTWSEDEVLQPPKTLIDHSTITRYKVWEGDNSHPKGVDFIVSASSSVVEGPSEPLKQASTSTRTRSLEDEVHGLRRESRRQT